jgi:hypothetical protein
VQAGNTVSRFLSGKKPKITGIAGDLINYNNGVAMNCEYRPNEFFGAKKGDGNRINSPGTIFKQIQ